MKFEKILPHVAIYIILMLAAFIYFKPVAFDGKSLREHDNVQARGMQAECHKYEKLEKKGINWTNQAFLGMPTYQIYGNYPSNQVNQITYNFFMFRMPVNTPHTVLFFMLLAAYLGLLAFGTDKWIALAGALSFGFLTNHLVLFEAGHSTKMHAMVYMIPVLAGTVMAYRGKILLAAGLTAFALAGQMAANHLQISYYTFLMMGFLAFAFLVKNVKEGKISSFVKASGALGLAVVLGIMSNLALLWTTYEYSSETIRGGSELKQFVLEEEDVKALAAKGLSTDEILKINQFGIVGKTIKTEKLFMDYMAAAIGPEKAIELKSDILTLAGTSKNKGLDKDYIFGWSYGIMETFTLIVPHFYGGANSKYFADDASKPGIQLGNSNSAQAMKKMMAKADPAQAQNISNQLFQMTSQYWGAQPFTSGPVYLGAVIFFLCILGMLMVKGPVKWGLTLVCGFFILLSWGDNFKAFNYLMVDYFPMYNKFRAVTMALSGVEVIAVIMAVLGLSEFIKYKDEKALNGETKGVFLERIFAAVKLKPTKINYLYTASAISLSAVLFVIFYSFTGTMEGANDGQLVQLSAQAPGGAEFYEAIKMDRAALMRSDAIRTLVFILLAAAALWLYAAGKIKQGLIAVGIVGLLSLIDLILIDRQYVNDDSFEKKREIVETPPATPADQRIMSDQTLHFRVYDLIAGLRGGGQPGNPFANSEGAFFHKIIGGYHAAKPILTQELSETYLRGREINPDYLHILGMLNVKYVIQSPEMALDNPEALGNVWLVDAIEYVNTADEELEYLAKLVPRSSAVTRKSNEAYLKGLQNTKTAGDYVTLTAYHPEKLTYKSKTANERFAVFSEIYYPPKKGWNVYIDGKIVKEGFIKVNYLLRGMRIPAGEHTIEFKFEPRSYSLGETSALICSLLIIGFLGFAIWWTVKNPVKEEKV
jgi:hypothetical protein